jgi:tape measure domain-containing protein
MSTAQSITSSTASRISRDAGVAERSVKSFWGSASGGSAFRPYSLIAVSRAFDNASDRAGLLRGAILATTGVFGGFAAALSSNLVLRYADSYTKLINQIRVVSSSSADAAARFQAIQEVADRSRSTLDATATLYSRIQKAAPDKSADDVLRYVETIQKALALGGATTEEARGAAIQFTQAIASNRLSGDEMRAVLETPLGLELAKGLGVTIGQMRLMGVAGKLTSDVVLGALSKISDEIDNRFSKSIRTIDQSILLLDNRFTAVIGQLSQSYGATLLFSNGIAALGNDLDKLIPTLVSVAGLLGAVYIARNKALAGGLTGVGIGAAIGNQLGGVTGALIGGAAGGLLGFKGPTVLENIIAQSKTSQEELKKVTEDVVNLRKEFLAAGQARSSAIAAQNTVDPVLAAKPSLQAQYRRVALDPKSTIPDIIIAKQAAVADGQKKLSDEVARTTANYKLFGGQLQKANVELASAARAATLAGQAKNFLGRSVSSLIGLFGGPWGIAITGAITLLSVLGLKAQENAAKVANAQQIVDEALNRSAASGNTSAQQSVLDRQLENLKANEDKLKVFAQQAHDAVGSSLTKFLNTGNIFNANTDYDAARAQIDKLIDALANGSMTTEEFRRRVEALGQEKGVGDIANAALDAAKGISDAALAAQELKKQVDALKASANTDIRFKIDFDTTKDKPNSVLTDSASALQDLEAEIKVSALRAKGLTAEADAQQIVNQAAKQGKTVSYDMILAKVKEKDALDAQASSLKKDTTALQTLTQKLAELKAESQGAFLPDIDREVLSQAKGLKIAASDLQAYIDAAKTGDFSKAPPQLVDLRSQLLYDQAADAARDIVKTYGDWSQIAPEAAAEQQKLNIAVANGAITSDQAKQAYADFLSGFQNFKWIDDISNAVGDLVKSGEDGFSGLADGAQTFIKTLRDMIVQLLIIQPLMNALKSYLSSGVGSGTGLGGFITSLLGLGGATGVATGAPMVLTGAVQHAGGVVGVSSGRTRPLSLAQVMTAPRFHAGLTSKEFATVLERGEHVLTEQMAGRTAATIDGLSRSMAGGRGSGVPAIHIHEAPGTTTTVKQQDDGTLHILAQFKGEIARDIAGNGVIGKTIATTFNTARRVR